MDGYIGALEIYFQGQTFAAKYVKCMVYYI